MKTRILTLLLLTSLAVSAQKNKKLKSYTASNGITYEVGDELQLGNGSNVNGSFVYITAAGMGAGAEDPSLDSRRAGIKAKIKRIREYNYKQTQGVHFYIGAGSPINYMVNIEKAIENCEVTPCEEKQSGTVVQSDKYDKLAKLKKLLDDGVLTQEEYEAEKKKILEF